MKPILEANCTIEAVMSGAPATTQPDFTASFADSFTATFSVDHNDGTLNSTTPVTLVSAPGSSGRDVREIIIFNRDTAAVTITVSYNNNGTLRTVDKFTLAADEKWVFSEAGAAGGGGVTDAGDLTFTPADNTDWTGSADPGNTNDALDQLAQRVTDHVADTAEHGATGAVVGTTNTQTLTNKRITKRVASTTDDATAVIDSDSYDEYYLTAVANATEISVTGTPTTGQTIFIGLKDAGVSKALTWTGITALGNTLPTATTAGKQHIIGIKYIASAWRAIAVAVEA